MSYHKTLELLKEFGKRWEQLNIAEQEQVVAVYLSEHAYPWDLFCDFNWPSFGLVLTAEKPKGDWIEDLSKYIIKWNNDEFIELADAAIGYVSPAPESMLNNPAYDDVYVGQRAYVKNWRVAA